MLDLTHLQEKTKYQEKTDYTSIIFYNFENILIFVILLKI